MAIKTTFATAGTPTALATAGQMQDAVGYPDVGDVTLGLAYGPALEFTGTKTAVADYPSEDDVRDGVDFDTGGQTGNMALPEVANVLDGVLYGTSGVELEGTHSDTATFSSDDPADLNLPSAIRAALLTSGRVVGLVAAYDFGDGDAPAVFTNDRFLFMCRRPLIFIEQAALTNNDEGDRASRSMEAQIIIHVWGNNTGSDVGLMQLAQEVWHVASRLSLSLTGWSVVSITAAAPDRDEDADNLGFPGYRVNLEANIIEE